MIYAWNIPDTGYRVDSIGIDDLGGETAENIHAQNGDYKIGYLGEQLVIWRYSRTGEDENTVTELMIWPLDEAGYIPPTVPTEP